MRIAGFCGRYLVVLVAALSILPLQDQVSPADDRLWQTDVFVMGTEGYDQRLVTFKSIVLWASIVYLIAATVWAFEKDKRKAGF